MLVHRHDERAVATLTLDSPPNRNALSTQLVGELREHLDATATDDSVRAVVLGHAGSVFCAGADLKEQSSSPEAGTRRAVELLRAVVEHPRPVIAAVRGAARAGGVGLVGACDIALAGPDASFAFTEARLGLAPAMISLTTLGRMNERAAARYFLTAEKLDARTAAAAGLVTSAAADLDAELAVVCDALRAASPQGLRETKRLTTAATLAAFDARADELQALSARLFASEEAAEGMLAFLEKRPPRWACA